MSAARYEIIRQIACGGMAEVLLARKPHDSGPEELVVLKRVLPHLNTEEAFLHMFAAEARVASQLRHPNIVSVLDVGEMDDLPFIAMERLDGADLLRLLQQCVVRRQNLGAAVAMAIVAGAARGLGYAHRARSRDGRPLKIIHRDVSPHNIFVTREGGVKLLDFGIAKSAAAVGYTMTGQVKGKVSYMSPEQIRAHPLDTRSDLWSLGVVLWESMAGEKLFTRDNDGATLHAILHDDIPMLQCAEAPGINDLVASILQRDPAHRIGTAEEIAIGLESLLRGMGVAAPARVLATRVSSLVPALNPALDAIKAPTRRTSQQVVTFAVSPAAHGVADSSPPVAPVSAGPVGVPRSARPGAAPTTRRVSASVPIAAKSEPSPLLDELPTRMHSVPVDADDGDSTVVERIPAEDLAITIRHDDLTAHTLETQAPPPDPIDPADGPGDDVESIDPMENSGSFETAMLSQSHPAAFASAHHPEAEPEVPTSPARANPANARVRPRGIKSVDEILPPPVAVGSQPAPVGSSADFGAPPPPAVDAAARAAADPSRRISIPAQSPAADFGALPFADFANRADTLAAAEVPAALHSVPPRRPSRSPLAALLAVAATCTVAGITLFAVRFFAPGVGPAATVVAARPSVPSIVPASVAHVAPVPAVAPVVTPPPVVVAPLVVAPVPVVALPPVAIAPPAVPTPPPPVRAPLPAVPAVAAHAPPRPVVPVEDLPGDPFGSPATPRPLPAANAVVIRHPGAAHSVAHGGNDDDMMQPLPMPGSPTTVHTVPPPVVAVHPVSAPVVVEHPVPPPVAPPVAPPPAAPPPPAHHPSAHSHDIFMDLP